MDQVALWNIFKYTNKIPKPKELVIGYQKLIDINLEPIKNYKSHLDELIEDTKKLEIEYKEFYNFFYNNFRFKNKVEEKFFKNKIWTYLDCSTKDANKIFLLIKDFTARMTKIEENHVALGSRLVSFSFKKKSFNKE